MTRLPERIRLLIADRSTAMRQTLLELVQEDYNVVGEVEDGKHVLREIEATTPGVVLLGVSFQGISGFEIARRLRAAGNKVKIIFVSFDESESLVQAALSGGAAGYVFMSRLLDDLPAALDAAARGCTFDPTRQKLS